MPLSKGSSEVVPDDIRDIRKVHVTWFARRVDESGVVESREQFAERMLGENLLIPFASGRG